MGNPKFTVGPGEGVFVDVPWDDDQGEVEVVLKFRPVRGRGRDRRRCEASYNGRQVTVERRPVEVKPKEAAGDE